MAPSFSLVINAGGQSRRMGQDKALLLVPPSGQPLWRHIVLRLRPLPLERVIVVSNQLATTQLSGLDLPVMGVPDIYPGVGPLSGIATGLQLGKTWSIVVACDMPLVKQNVFQALCALASEQAGDSHDRWDAIVPEVKGYAQPLHALYHPRVVPAIQTCLTKGERRANSFLADVRVRWVSEAELCPLDPDLHSFYNANTPEEWADAIHLLKLESGVMSDT